MTATCAPAEVCIGPFMAGEIPDPILYQYLQADGAPLPLTGYTAQFCWAERWGGGGTGPATISDPAAGEVTYTWGGPEVATPGQYTGLFWVAKTGSRYASVPIRFAVLAPACRVA